MVPGAAVSAAGAACLATALGEDFAIGETIQRNFPTGANTRQTFGKFEKALGWYHSEVARTVEANTAP